MKGDFSSLRLPLRPNDDGVWLQQGRPLMDSDWNAATQLARRRGQDLVADLVGHAGGPPDAGFAILPRCEVLLNHSQPGELAFRQFLTLRHTPSLPFRWDEMFATAQPGADGIAAELAEGDGGGDGVYTLQLGLNVPKQAHGTILCRPGNVALWLDGDRRLHVGSPDRREDMPTPAVIGFDAPFTLILTHTGRRYFVAVNGHEAAEWVPAHRPGWPARAENPALVIGCSRPEGEDSASDFLTCGVDALRLWRGIRRQDQLHAEVSRGAEHREHLVCALDFSQLHDHRVADRSGFGNDGHLHGREGANPIVMDGLHIGAGRYYVDGLAIANPAGCDFRHQPFSPEPPRLPQGRVNLVYLRAWERFVTALERPDLREVALGGPDTTGRTQLVWQIRAIEGDSREQVEEAFRRLVVGTPPGTMRLWTGGAIPTANNLYRVEVHNSGWPLARPLSPVARAHLVAADVIDPAGGLVRPQGAVPALPVGQPVLVTTDPSSLDSPLADDRVTVQTVIDRLDANCGIRLRDLPVACASVRQVWLLPVASFKWSADNGCVAYRIQSVSSLNVEGGAQLGRITLHGPGFNGLDLRVGDTVEVVEEADELAHRPGTLHIVQGVDPSLLRVDVAPFPAAQGQTPRILRKWDNGGGIAIPLDDRPQALTSSVTVRFGADGYYTSGEYWTAALRSTTEAYAAWPQHEGRPAALPPDGRRMVRAPLALVFREERGIRTHDLRNLFTPLSELTRLRADAETLEWMRGFRGWVERSRLHFGQSWEDNARQHILEVLEDVLPRLLERHAPRPAAPAEHHEPAPSPHPAPPPALRPVLEWVPVAASTTPNATPAGRGRATIIGRRLYFIGDGGEWMQVLDLDTLGWQDPVKVPQPRKSFWLAAAGDALVLGGGEEQSVHGEGLWVFTPDHGWSHHDRNIGRALHAAAAALGHRLVVAGGMVKPQKHLIEFHRPHPEISAEAVIFDPAQPEHAESLTPLRRGVGVHAMAVSGSHLWVIGGLVQGGVDSNAVDVLDLRTGQWEEGPTLAQPLSRASAAGFGGGVVVVGGKSAHGVVRSVLWCQDGGHKWEADVLPALGAARSLAGVAVDGERLLVVGGENEDGPVAGCEILEVKKEGQ